MALRRLVNGYQLSQALHVAVTLGIADLLAAGPRSSDDLAAATATHPRSLYRLLRALAAAGVLGEDDERRFALTPLGDCLRTDAPGSLASWVTFIVQPYHRQAWDALEHSVRSGENAFRHVHGADVWEYRAAHPELGAVFDAAMTASSRQIAGEVLDTYDFGRFSTVVDVGGGRGALLAAILARYPEMHGVLFDQPHVLAGAAELLATAGVADRCEVVAGSFFESVPTGGDAYVLKAVLHDWEDEPAAAILRTCRQAMTDGAALLAIERRLEPPGEGIDGKLSDLNMLVSPGGQERTEPEYAALFEQSGFRLVRSVPSAVGVDVVEAVAVEAGLAAAGA